MNVEGTNPTKDRSLCSLIVTTYKRPAQLRATLHSLLTQSYSNIEVIVVCDGDDAEVRSIASELNSEQLIRWVFHTENRGLPAARNTGVREAKGDIVLFFDDDIQADRELVELHMSHHLSSDRHQRLLVCGRNDEISSLQNQSFLNRCLCAARVQTLADGATKLLETDTSSIGDEVERSIWCGLNSSIRRDLFIHYGGFNEHFRASDEELELGERLYLTGFNLVFEPRAFLIHKNTKELATYLLNAWRSSGTLDPYRVFKLKQKNEQTKSLVSIFHGHLIDRVSSRLAWHLPAPFRSIANLLEKAANQTRWSPLCGAWARTTQVSEYWSSVKATGCTLQQLRQVAGRPKCALMLHSVSPPLSKDEASYYISPPRFHRMMRKFRARGFDTATLAQWLNDEVPEKRVLLTFDDAYDDLYTELFPLVQEHGLKPVIFLVADRIGSSNLWDQETGLRARNLMTIEQIREMQKYGVEFGSHTLTHPWLPDVSDEQLHREVNNSKQQLEDLLGTEIISFAYPFGGVDRRVRAAVAQAGYKLAFTTQPGTNWWNDPLCQRRGDINETTSMLDFSHILKNGQGFAQSVATCLRSMEQELPTAALRGLARTLRGLGHKAYHRTSAN